MAAERTSAIIGGGIAGALCADALATRGESCVLFDRNRLPGGVWSADRHFAVYDDLVLNTSTEISALYDDRMFLEAWKGRCPDFCDYVDHVDRFISQWNVCTAFRSARDVTDIHPLDDYLFRVSWTGTSSGIKDAALFNHVILATGVHSTPNIPKIRGLETFLGKVMHSSQAFPQIDTFKDKRVLIVGLGNSGGDLAVRLHGVAASVSLSARNPTWVVPRYLSDKPIDHIVTDLENRYGANYTRHLFDAVTSGDGHFCAMGSDANGALDFRDCRIVTNCDLGPLIRTKDVRVFNRIDGTNGSTVTFENGDTAEFDHIVLSAGFKNHPFGVKNSASRSNPLVCTVCHDRVPGLWSAGLTPIWGSAARVSKRQAQLIARLISEDANQRDITNIASRSGSYRGAEIVFENGGTLPEFNSLCRYFDTVEEALSNRMKGKLISELT